MFHRFINSAKLIVISLLMITMFVGVSAGYLGALYVNAIKPPIKPTIITQTKVSKVKIISPFEARKAHRYKVHKRGILNPIIDRLFRNPKVGKTSYTIGVKSKSMKIIRKWSPINKALVSLLHLKTFVHFTGEGCIDCHFQWAAIDEEQLKLEAEKSKVWLFEAKIIPGADNAFIVSELAKHKIGGVPAYVLKSSGNKWSILNKRLREVYQVFSTDNTHILIDDLNKLN